MLNLRVVCMLGLGLMLGGCQNDLESYDIDDAFYYEDSSVEVSKVEEEVIELTLEDKLKAYAEENDAEYKSYVTDDGFVREVRLYTKFEGTIGESYFIRNAREKQVYVNMVLDMAKEIGTLEGYRVVVEFLDDNGESVSVFLPTSLGETVITLNDECIGSAEWRCENIQSVGGNVDALANAGLTLANFNKYEDGMTMEEVETLFGIDWELYSSTEVGDTKQTIYTWEEEGKIVVVQFTNYKSSAITQRGLK